MGPGVELRRGGRGSEGVGWVKLRRVGGVS